MKVLFVGEGPGDIGRPEFAPQPRPAIGVVTVLARKVCPVIDPESVALAWHDIPILERSKRKKGYAARTASAILLAQRVGCGATVCVVDRDRDEDRMRAMEEGKDRALQLITHPHLVVCGVAFESIEAWTLGDPEALAAVLGVDLQKLRKLYKLGDVESLYELSGKQDNRPKHILAQVAELKHQRDCTAFREQVAELTDINALQRNCPNGFKPFAEQLRAAFGSK